MHADDVAARARLQLHLQGSRPTLMPGTLASMPFRRATGNCDHLSLALRGENCTFTLLVVGIFYITELCSRTLRTLSSYPNTAMTLNVLGPASLRPEIRDRKYLWKSTFRALYSGVFLSTNDLPSVSAPFSLRIRVACAIIRSNNTFWHVTAAPAMVSCSSCAFRGRDFRSSCQSDNAFFTLSFSTICSTIRLTSAG